jgi:hypothetical protein
MSDYQSVFAGTEPEETAGRRALPAPRVDPRAILRATADGGLGPAFLPPAPEEAES